MNMNTAQPLYIVKSMNLRPQENPLSDFLLTNVSTYKMQ